MRYKTSLKHRQGVRAYRKAHLRAVRRRNRLFMRKYYKKNRTEISRRGKARRASRRKKGLTPYSTSRYKRRKASGLCVRCGKKPVAGKAMCQRCLEYVKRAAKRYRPHMPAAVRGRTRAATVQWRSDHRARCNEIGRAYYKRLRSEVFNAYGKKCKCCGESSLAFLTIDHIAGGGQKHRGEIRTTLYAWLKSNGFPPGFQALCWNCNLGKAIYGVCPHRTRREN